MKKSTLATQVAAGLRRAAAWLAGVLWLGLVVAGIGIAFKPGKRQLSTP